MRYTLHQSLVWIESNGEPPSVDNDEEARFEDETVTYPEARTWIASPPEAGAIRAQDIHVDGLGRDYVLWYVPVANSRALVVRWVRKDKGATDE
jgi:hypothetical protein